jgi:AraC-like DNA-binding protein
MKRAPPQTVEGGPSPGVQGAVGVHHACKTSDLDELEDSLSSFAVSQKLVPSTRATSRESRFRFDGVGALGMFDVSFGCSLAVESPPIETDDRLRNVFFVMASKGRGQLLMGREEFAINDTHSVVLNSGLPRAIQFMEDCQAQVLTIDHHRIAKHCMQLLGRDVEETTIRFETRLALDDPAGQSWLRLVQYATTELIQPSSLIKSLPAARQQLEQMVMTGLLFGHSHNFTDELLRPQPAAAPYYVKRAEAYIEHHFADSLSLADIAAIAGVSARSLQTGFRNFRNMTPMEYLRSVRLQNVHHNLLVADPATVTITDIAMQAGFSHMGEFAALYKRVYDVPPSQTLWR